MKIELFYLQVVPHFIVRRSLMTLINVRLNQSICYFLSDQHNVVRLLHNLLLSLVKGLILVDLIDHASFTKMLRVLNGEKRKGVSTLAVKLFNH